MSKVHRYHMTDWYDGDAHEMPADDGEHMRAADVLAGIINATGNRVLAYRVAAALNFTIREFQDEWKKQGRPLE